MSSTFREAAAACSALRDRVRDGLQAVRRGHRSRIVAAESRRLAGSVDLDAALSAELPHAPRWDYGIGYRPSGAKVDAVHWIEVHPASDGDVAAVDAKLTWLKHWLATQAADLDRLDRRFVWVSSGRTGLTQASPGLRRLAQKGCRHVGSGYRIG